MRFISKTTWEEVFSQWKNHEGSNPEWVRLATEEKGWPDWESWRRGSLSLLKPETLSWEVFEFTDPLNEISSMVMGPYKAWQQGVENKNQLTFSELLEVPSEYERFAGHKGVVERMNNFPDTPMIAVVRADNGKLVCIEGHHRACAVALAKKLGKEIIFKNPVRIAIAKLPLGNEALLDAMLVRGTKKDSV